MALTIQDAFNNSNPVNLADLFRAVPLGDLLAGMIPSTIARTGLVASATHVEPEPGAISLVSIAPGAVLAILLDGVPGAGEVLVTYDADGVATLLFGDGAQTAYKVTKSKVPPGLGALLARSALGWV